MAELSRLASAMRSNPTCKIVIMGNGNASKIDQQRSWDRVNAVINYLVDKQGIGIVIVLSSNMVKMVIQMQSYRSAGDGKELKHARHLS